MRGIIIICFLILICSPISPAVAQIEKKTELRALQTHIKKLAQKLEQQIGEKNEQQGKLRTIEKKLATLQSSQKKTRLDYNAAEKHGRKLEQQHQDLSGRLASQFDALTNLVKASYRMGNQPYLKLLLNQHDPASIGRSMTYYQYIARARKDRIVMLEKQSQALLALRTESLIHQAKLTKLQEKLDTDTHELSKQKNQREQQLVLIDKNIISQENKVKKLKADEKRLLRLIRSLAEERISRSRQQAAPKANQVPDQNHNRTPGENFAQMKGKLPFPVNGRVQTRFGQKNRESGVASDGVLFKAREDSPVVAVFDGQIAYADWFRGFGLLTIVDHGDGFMSLYSHNKQLNREIGDWVAAGEQIASVGDTGGLPSPGLYFEIRQNGAPVNPLNWCRG